MQARKFATDVVLCASFGDSGKGRVVADKIKAGSYTHAMRACGGGNAGHQFYMSGKKITTHVVPTGALFGVRSIIGPGCVINEAGFWKEVADLQRFKPDILDHIRIAKNAHMVELRHLEEETGETKIGTTRQGIGPAYRDKHARVGMRAESVASFEPLLVDIYEEFYRGSEPIELLIEGAQGLGLDIAWSPHYPYCTSSHTDVGGIISNGVPHTSLRHICLVCKPYDTYVGTREFQDRSDPILDQIADVGHEYGSTTGRRRQVNYLDLDLLTRSVQMSCATHLTVNKMDILQQVGVWKVRVGSKVADVESENGFKNLLENRFPHLQINYNYSPEHS